MFLVRFPLLWYLCKKKRNLLIRIKRKEDWIYTDDLSLFVRLNKKHLRRPIFLLSIPCFLLPSFLPCNFQPLFPFAFFISSCFFPSHPFLPDPFFHSFKFQSPVTFLFFISSYFFPSFSFAPFFLSFKFQSPFTFSFFISSYFSFPFFLVLFFLSFQFQLVFTCYGRRERDIFFLPAITFT